MDYRGYYIHRIIYYIYIVYVEALYWKVEIILALKFRGYIAYYQFRREVKFLTRPGSNVRRDEGSRVEDGPRIREASAASAASARAPWPRLASV